ncbi:MAG TPA: DegT/DnrJ/EryC1/StrS family aminotransferase [Thermoanaerobaculia bacterium]|nr:DegT/DnrJ/EryC1/StrS family aminotransferase [Thermoanaerobaculia bacterium]
MIPLSRATVTEEMKKAILEVVDSGRFILGPETKAFEKEFAEYIGVRHAVAVSQGTAAIQLAIQGIGVKPGDEVLVPSMTAFPTIEGVIHAGAVPVFVDNDSFGCMDPADARRRITKRAVGMVPVHLYGGAADLDGLEKIARERGLWLLEDCCQAHGALHRGRKTGSIGRAGAFSFYPSKNLTVFGDGGMVTTDDDQVASRVRLLRDHGRSDKYTHVAVGYNLRFNDVMAAVGRRQLALLEDFVAKRRSVAARYRAGLRELAEIELPDERPETRMVYHLYPIRCRDDAIREDFREHMKSRGIETGVHYPIANHLQPAMADRGQPPILPEAEALAATTVSLPMFPALSDADTDAVIAAVRDFFRESPSAGF